MRSDYDYVSKATAVCLTTTAKGHREASKVTGEEPVSPKVDILLAVEQDYFAITDPALRHGVVFWYGAFAHEYERQYECECPATLGDFKEAISEGLLSFKLVIWDD